ncbi:MAG TPA: Spy/CpxP family protein refolding chaperone [Spirochaetota bacterium]|nr:Spy/CpxP family protein refolding chaperone [Spirochaetota bacterium]HPF05736.1 Spy/CpxP family protein refolding chaperone [Spirochaetota bacterium]HPJ42635.1 Spy/CpxP family protein refolding chaperone [Spirochaetota bacterium]HPR37250.1 Spy/CpxP family protein refolding chaperone [Spirochaetota bacterium]HRX47434.1 Spy/CpxP family protein refolding chaperone [Spirochaetota bacterium]
MNSRIIIIILSVIIAVLVTVNIMMFREHREPPFMPGPGGGPEFMNEGPGMEGRHQMQGNRYGRNFCGPDFMREKLNLNSEQIKRIEELNRKFREENEVIFRKMEPEKERLRSILQKNDKPDMSDVRKSLEKMASLNIELQMLRINQGAEIDSLLSPEQKEVLKNERNMFFERMRRRHGSRNE